MTLTRVTPLAGDTILPLADAKLHLRVTHDSEDTLITSLRDAAISHVERVSGVALLSGSWEWAFRAFPSGRVSLPIGPVTAVTVVAYYDADGVEQAYADARLIDGYAYPGINDSWPTAYDYAAITFTAGLASADDAPDLLAAVKLMLTHLYENRSAVNVGSAVNEIPLAVASLIDTYRKVMV